MSVDKMCKMTPDQLGQILRWFASQKISVQTEIMVQTKNQKFDKSISENVGEIRLAALALAAYKTKHLLEYGDKRKTDDDKSERVEKLADLTKRRIEAIRKGRKKKFGKKSQAIENLYSVIKNLRENEKLSYAEIALYLQKFHSIKISGEHLRRNLKQIEERLK